MKSFAQAALLTYIDPNVMRKAVRFLINNQIKETGEYKEKGVVYQKSMQVCYTFIKWTDKGNKQTQLLSYIISVWI